MAHQDYVSRSSKKKSNPYKKKPAEQSNGIPLKLKLIIVITLIAGSAFGYFLWEIKDTQPSETATPAAEQTTKTAEKAKLPEPPKEKWAYRKELAEKEIEVGQYQVENKGPYKMQCGSFRTRKQAEVLKANIAFAGLESFIRAAEGSSSTWYQVRLGPYARKRLAEADKHKLKNNNVNHCQISLWR
ncbi:SPOR domain-containing protein [Thalassotalea sp. PLHSN55]|uniref:SPOR domain-containing protein n=1 Tax=Thalassotalea sp. PLHSN55 TaxID=3435888 RepID=UPI003F84C499